MYGEREVVPTREKKTERNRFHTCKNETVSIFLIFQSRWVHYLRSKVIHFRSHQVNNGPSGARKGQKTVGETAAQ